MDSTYSFEKSSFGEAKDVIYQYAENLSYSTDSFMEDRLFECQITKIIYSGEKIGFVGTIVGKLFFFRYDHMQGT